MGFNPFYWCDSPLPMELIYKLIGEVKELQKQYTDINTIVNELKKYIDDLGETITDEVKQYIRQMYENGTLKDMIAELLTEIPIRSYVPISRIGRIINKSVDNIFENGDSASYNSEYYSFPQGSTTFTIAGIRYFAVAYICSNYSDYRYNDNAKLVIYNESGEEIKSVYLSAGHANGITYNENDGYIYIIPWKFYNNSNKSTPSYDIIRIPFDNFNAPVERKTCIVSGGVGFIGIDCYNGQLFISDNNNNVYEYDWDSNISKLVVIADQKIINRVVYCQTFSVTAQYIYFITYMPSQIIRYNRVTNTFDYVYNINRQENQGLYTFGEGEGIKAYDNGDIYIITAQHMNKKRFSLYDMCQFWKCNVSNNTFIPLNPHPYDYQSMFVYVSKNKKVFNPDGSEEKPFNYLTEAVLFAGNQNIAGKVSIIIIDGDYSNEYIYFESSSIALSISRENDDYTKIGGVCIDGGNLSLLHFEIFNIIDSNTPVSSAEKYAHTSNIFIRYGTINLTSPIFSKLEAKKDDMTAIYGRRCLVNLTNPTFNDITIETDFYNAIYNNSGELIGY